MMSGNLVRHHEEGYTSFVVYLHNATSSFIGQSETVVAVYLDATTSEVCQYLNAQAFHLLVHIHILAETFAGLLVETN